MAEKSISDCSNGVTFESPQQNKFNRRRVVRTSLPHVPGETVRCFCALGASGPCRAAATGMETARMGGQLLVVLDGMVQGHVVSKPIIFLYRVDQVSAAGPERKFQSTLLACGPWNTPRILRPAPRPPAPALVSRRQSASRARPRGRAPTCDARVASPVEFFENRQWSCISE